MLLPMSIKVWYPDATADLTAEELSGYNVIHNSDGSLEGIIATKIGGGSSSVVIGVEGGPKGLDYFAFKGARADEDGNIDIEHAGQIMREAMFLKALTTLYGEDTTDCIGRVIEFVKYKGPTDPQDLVKDGKVVCNALVVARGVPIPELTLGLQKIVNISLDVSYALARLHKWGIVHCDVKPNNILMVADVACLGDFGLAGVYDTKKLPKRIEHLADIGVGFGGTFAYQPPELYPRLRDELFYEESLREGSSSSSRSGSSSFISKLRQIADGEFPDSGSSSLDIEVSSSDGLIEEPPSWPAVDVYSFGVTLWELITGARPFTQEKPALMLRAKLDGPPAISAKYGQKTLEYDLLGVAHWCMSQNAELRPPIADVHENIASIAERHGLEVDRESYRKEWMR